MPDLARQRITVEYHENGDIKRTLQLVDVPGYLGRPVTRVRIRTPIRDNDGTIISVEEAFEDPPVTREELLILKAKTAVSAENRNRSYLLEDTSFKTQAR